jgi:hypothetical protein
MQLPYPLLPYYRGLAPCPSVLPRLGGSPLFHVSNRCLDLTPVVARLAADVGASVRHLLVPPVASARRRSGVEVVAVAAPDGELDALAADGWDSPQPGPVIRTDERSLALTRAALHLSEQ